MSRPHTGADVYICPSLFAVLLQFQVHISLHLFGEGGNSAVVGRRSKELADLSLHNFIVVAQDDGPAKHHSV